MLEYSSNIPNVSNDINIFDLKKYLKDLLDFIENMISNEIVFDNELKLSIMPGLISKLTKLMQSNIKITTKILEKICKIQNVYIDILFNKENIGEKNNDLNKKKFCEFYEAFIIILFDKYKSKITGNLIDTVIKMNINYIKSLNKKKYINLINYKFFENIFCLINNQIFEDLNISIINNNSIYDKLDSNYQSFDEFYITYIKSDLFSNEKINKKIYESITIIENAYVKKEFLKFNRNLIELIGNIKLILHYNEIKNINDNGELYNILFNFFGKIIKMNKNHIFYEVINSYEFIFLNINKAICKTNIISEFFNSVLNTYNKEYKLHLLLIFMNHIYKSFPNIYTYFFNSCLNQVIDITKKFNNKLIKKKFVTYTQLNEAFSEVLNSFILFEFLILFHNNRKKLEKKETKKIISLINFFYDLFLDTDNEEHFNKAKISDIKLSLVNIFLINLSVLC